MGIHGTTAIVSWIFMQSIVPQERSHMPLTGAILTRLVFNG